MTNRQPVDIETIRAYIRHHQAEAARWEQILQLVSAEPGLLTTPPVASHSGAGRNHRKRAQQREEPSIADRVEGYLTASATPLALPELVKALKADGVRVTPKNLANILNRWVSRGERFHRPAPNTFARKM